MAGLLCQTIADAGRAGGGVGEAASGDDEGVAPHGGPVLQAYPVAVVGERLDGAVFAYLHILPLLQIGDEGKEDVE